MSRRKCVLIVDDSLVIRSKVRSLFESKDFDVCDAENGMEALRSAQESHPHLIILDLCMPVMNGLDAARKLKQLMPLIPLVMFSNTVGPIVEQEARAAGISAVFSKSDSAEQLITLASELLT